ncbi:MAG: hypothetical protein FWE40_10230 [Oscillospiraceae bacterium]|nr:hypothetical protein [Oscillospiraceae bacterium]
MSNESFDDWDDEADMEFCLQLENEYENDPDKGDTISLEEFAAQLGISLEEIYNH